MTGLLRSARQSAALWVGAATIAAVGASSVAAQARGPAAREDAAVAYAQCMRDKGFTEFPDPAPDGRMQLRVTAESAPRFQKAQEACRSLAPAGIAGGAISPANLEAL